MSHAFVNGTRGLSLAVVVLACSDSGPTEPPCTGSCEPPVITALPVTGGTAGGSPFLLAVDGEHFTEESVVQWNGADRVTRFESEQRLSASITLADLRQPRTSRVRVRTRGIAERSNEVEFTTRVAPEPALISQITADVSANDVVWDATRSRLYASIPDGEPTHGNSVVAIDPTTGDITASVAVGLEPYSLAISDDDQFLYISLRGANSIRRVTLASFTADLEIPLGARRQVEDMHVIPGAPASLVVAKARDDVISPVQAGVFVYDGEVARPNATPGGSNTIAFDGRSASMLYGFSNESSAAGFRTMAIDATGIRVTGMSTSVAAGQRLTGAGGRIYTTLGAIIDPTIPEVTRRITVVAAHDVYPEPALGRVYFLYRGWIDSYDANTLEPLGSIEGIGPLRDYLAHTRVHLTRWGPDGFAYPGETQVFIIRSTLPQS